MEKISYIVPLVGMTLCIIVGIINYDDFTQKYWTIKVNNAIDTNNKEQLEKLLEKRNKYIPSIPCNTSSVTNRLNKIKIILKTANNAVKSV